MPTGNNPARRFILTHQHSASDRNWNSLGIEPLLYQLGDDGNHDEAAQAIAELAEYQRRSPSTWRQLIAQTVSQPTPPVDASSLNVADRALQDPELTPTFTANAENINWIQWCLDRGHLKGVFDHQPLEVSEPLLSWTARLLTSHDPYEAIAIIQQGRPAIAPAIMVDDRSSATDGPTIPAWPQEWNAGFPIYSPPLHQTKTDANQTASTNLPECVSPMISTPWRRGVFKELCQPVITAQSRRPSGQDIKLRTVGEPWALSRAWSSIREHLEVIAPKVIEQAAKQMERRHSILEQWGQADHDQDEDSSGRHLVEESQYNYREADIDIILDAARDCLEWAVTQRPTTSGAMA